MFRVYVWTREDGGHWRHGNLYATEAEAACEVTRLERALGVAVTYEAEDDGCTVD